MNKKRSLLIYIFFGLFLIPRVYNSKDYIQLKKELKQLNIVKKTI